jgi:hypothetical protein
MNPPWHDIYVEYVQQEHLMHHKPFCQQMNPNKKCMLSSTTRSGGCQNCSQHNDEENRACCADGKNVLKRIYPLLPAYKLNMNFTGTC